MIKPYYDHNGITIYHGDCLDIMKQLKGVDLIFTSPTYEDVSGAGYTAIKKDLLFLKLYSEFINKVFGGYKDILKTGGQVLFNIKSKTLNKTLRTPHWVEFTEGFSLLDFKSYIIWKYAGSFDSTNKRFHLDYEIIYHLSNGSDIFLNTEIDDKDPLTSVWYVPHNIPQKDRVHPTQMPIALAERAINLTTRQGETVYDSFMGSGTTAVAAQRLGRRFIGSELSEEHCETAVKRLSQEMLPFR